MENSFPTLWFVIPCFNEGSMGGYCIKETMPQFLSALTTLIDQGKCSGNSRILYVDDGSGDDTWNIIQESSCDNELIEGLKLSRNRGHQNALLAGLMEAKDNCDLTISMDCDGQDDVSIAEKMLQAYKDGFDIVYGVRSKRETDTVFKRFTAENYYRLMKRMGVEVVFNHADYRMMSARALEGLSEFEEVNLFLRGMVPMVGFPSTIIEYDRAERAAGDSHYPLGKMIALAVNGITSLSIRPIRIIAIGGLAFSVLGIIGIIWAVISIVMDQAIPGWASTICILCLIGGLQMFSLGVIGEYIGKIYLETKHRPRYIIEQRTY